MKILMLSTGFSQQNGVTVVTQKLTQLFREEQALDVDVLTFWPWEKNHAPVIFYSREKQKVFSFVHEFLTEIVPKQYDLLIFHNTVFSDIFLRVLPGEKATITDILQRFPGRRWLVVHSLAGRGALVDRLDLVDSFHLEAEQQLMGMADTIIHLTEEQQEMAKAFYPKHHVKTVVIPNGVDLANPITAMEQEETKRSYGFSDEVIGLFLGRVSPEKGVLELLSALPVIKKEFPAFMLLIAGNKEDDPFSKRAQQHALQLGLEENRDYRFLGWISDSRLKQRLISQAKIIVIPSYWEHFPLVALEAMAMDIPVVISDVEGPRGVFHLRNVEKRLALPIPAVSPKDISNRVIYALQHPSTMSEISARAKKEVLRQWTWSAVGKHYSALLWRVSAAQAVTQKIDCAAPP